MFFWDRYVHYNREMRSPIKGRTTMTGKSKRQVVLRCAFIQGILSVAFVFAFWGCQYEKRQTERAVTEAEKSEAIPAVAKFHEAVQSGNIEMAEDLLQQNPDYLNASGPEGKTALHLACASGHAEVVSLLLEKGVDIQNRDENELTPLHFAARNGNAQVCQLLLEKGADPLVGDRWERYPVAIAARKGNDDAAHVIEEHLGGSKTLPGMDGVCIWVPDGVRQFSGVIGVERYDEIGPRMGREDLQVT